MGLISYNSPVYLAVPINVKLNGRGDDELADYEGWKIHDESRNHPHQVVWQLNEAAHIAQPFPTRKNLDQIEGCTDGVPGTSAPTTRVA